MTTTITVPDWVWQVPYDGAAHPGAVPRSAMREGANCQLFAYEVLGLHGLAVPDFWSSDLWDDDVVTMKVDEPQPLDLVLFSQSQDSHGAHLGVVVGQDEVLHLCQEVGKPVIWAMAEFAARPHYAVVLGHKRVRPL